MSNFSIIPLSQKNEFSISAEHESLQFKIIRSDKIANYKAKPDETIFGYSYSGLMTLEEVNGRSSAKISSEMYFSLDSTWKVSSEGSCLLIISKGYQGLNIIGGPLEQHGRLKYIDNCTDSLIIPPTKWGDPCLNLLSFPTEIKQTAHTHPSFRAGVVLSGAGTCILESQILPLTPGDFFFIPANLKHSFRTGKNCGLRVLAFHPDSDFGPTDQIHPMINKTIIGG